MSKKILIGSLQYSPIYKTHCCALGNQCEKFGYSVQYLFNRNYEWILSDQIKKKSILLGDSTGIFSAILDGIHMLNRYTLKEIIEKERPDFIYMYNVHPFFNFYLAKLSNQYGITFIQHIHEPFVANKSVYKRVHQYWLHVFEYFQERLLNRTDIAVLSSQIAFDLFKNRYQNFHGKMLLIPLMYEDTGQISSDDQQRRYITFIGPPVPAKGPDIFARIVAYSKEHRLGHRFILVSRKKIKDRIFKNKENLTIIYKEKISDNEMNHWLKQSILTITPYTIATQSSVVLTSFMNGTPVLASNIGGLPEVVHHLKTGYLVNIESNERVWIEGIDHIIHHLAEMSVNCRNYFVQKFSEVNWPTYFGELFESN